MEDNTPERDPEEIETKQLHKFLPLEERNVLEIGAGSGRMTWRFAHSTRTTTSIDIELDDLVAANAARPSNVESKVVFANSDVEHLPFSTANFDAVIFAWSF